MPLPDCIAIKPAGCPAQPPPSALNTSNRSDERGWREDACAARASRNAVRATSISRRPTDPAR
ncbi:hypothetical protein ASE85_06660 [Sphingobium sp. Leaf26]|nr:hypothetical protein ASE85_06660 [Sphingobium sp. Leaf26]